MRYGLDVALKAPRFAALGNDTVELRARHVLAALLMVLNYRWTVAGGDGSGAIRTDAHAWLLEKIVASANGDYQTYDGPFLDMYTLLFLAEVLEQIPPTLLAAGSDQAARRAVWLLPQQMGHSYMPEEFGLPTAAVAAPALTVYWGNGRRMVTTPHAAAVISIIDTAVELYERAYVDPVPPRGGFAPLLVVQTTQDVVQSGSGVIVELSNKIQKGHEIRAVFVQAYKSGTVGGNDFVAANDVATALRLHINAKAVVGLERKIPFHVLQNINKTVYGLSATKTGLVVLDSAEDKRTSKGELWTVTHPTEKPYLEVDVTDQAGDCKLVVTTVFTARR